MTCLRLARGCVELAVAAGNGQSQSLDREGPIELCRECLFDALFGGVVVLAQLLLVWSYCRDLALECPAFAF